MEAFTAEGFLSLLFKLVPEDFGLGREFDFLIPVDVVIVGPCPLASVSQDGGLSEEARSYPMGRCGYDEDPSGSRLQSILSPYKLNCAALVIPSCCREYGQSYKDLLRRLYPAVLWHFPEIFDFKGDVRSNMELLVGGLMSRGVIETRRKPGKEKFICRKA